jgi:uracil-DNA glycosylase
LSGVKVVAALGRIGFHAFLKGWVQAGRKLPPLTPRFSHGSETDLPGGVTLLASYHPSQRNTQTGLLTAAMFSGIFERAGRLIGRTGRRR